MKNEEPLQRVSPFLERLDVVSNSKDSKGLQRAMVDSSIGQRGVAIVIGEVLWDCFPDRRVLGGAPLNVAWNLAGMGIDPLFISAVGDDELGREILSRMKAWGMTTDGVAVVPGVDTGTVQVTLHDGEPHYDIVTGVAYDRIEMPNAALLDSVLSRVKSAKAAGLPSVLYHGTLAYRSPTNRTTIQALRDQFSDADVFFDINVRKPHYDVAWLSELMPDAGLVKLNEDEMSDVAGWSVKTAEDRINAAQAVMDQYPTIDRLLVTLGAKGAQCFVRGDKGQSNSPIEVVAPKPKTMVDPVGAGDAFASVMIAGHLKNSPIESTLHQATTFASKVCGLAGATSDDRAFYEAV